MKRTITIAFSALGLLAMGLSSHAQTVYEVAYASQADVKVFEVAYESQADIKVFKVDYESQATAPGLWYLVDYQSQADVTTSQDCDLRGHEGPSSRGIIGRRADRDARSATGWEA